MKKSKTNKDMLPPEKKLNTELNEHKVEGKLLSPSLRPLFRLRRR